MTFSYSDAELEALLRDLETERVERKESFNSGPVREAVCAMANDLIGSGRPGVVFVGAQDDGMPAGLAITDQLLLQLTDIRTDGNIVPPPTLFVQKRRLAGGDMAVITVVPSDSPPVRYKGRIHVRVGPRRGVASAQEERILNERRQHRDRPFDVQPVHSASLNDLDLRRFETDYLPGAVAPDVLAANARTLEQRLAATKMVASPSLVPTVLGVLVLGKTPRDFLPGAYVQFLRVQGSTLTGSILDEELIDGDIAAVIRRLDDKLEAHNQVRVDFVSGSRETRSPLYPSVALQQLTRNALLHRTYQVTNAPVRVTWFDDRLEIQSPGGPYGQVTPENFGQPGITDYRNPNLAEALRVLGYVQRFGAGIGLARAALAQNGNPDVTFSVDASYVLAQVRPATGPVAQ